MKAVMMQAISTSELDRTTKVVLELLNKILTEERSFADLVDEKALERAAYS